MQRCALGRLAVGVGLAVAGFLPAPAVATMPGPNGKIAFNSDRNGTHDVWSVDADGTGETLLYSDGEADFNPWYPAWAPDGRDIAVMREHRQPDLRGDVFVMEADGANLRQVTFTDGYHVAPAWSPDGSRIVFGAGPLKVSSFPPDGDETPITQPDFADYDTEPDWSPNGNVIAFTRYTPSGPFLFGNIYAVAPVGGEPRALTSGTDAVSSDPSISPDGNTVVFARAADGRSDLYTLPIGGGTPTQLTDTPDFSEEDPAWSPDGTKIAFAGKGSETDAVYDIYTVNADGSGRAPVTTSAGNDTQPTWQRVVPVGYPRPKAAPRITVSLVPAFDRCTAPNRTHGPPLEHGSCSPPDQASDFVTVGTPDANGHAPNSIGSVTLRALTGDPSTAADEADVHIRAQVTDVRERSGAAAPYPWSLWTRLAIRLTDEDNGCCGFPATLRDELLLNVETPCAPASGPSVGTTCAVATTADTIIPGVVREGMRATWQLTRPVHLYDAGPDFGGADATLFATQGVFIP